MVKESFASLTVLLQISSWWLSVCTCTLPKSSGLSWCSSSVSWGPLRWNSDTTGLKLCAQTTKTTFWVYLRPSLRSQSTSLTSCNDWAAASSTLQLSCVFILDQGLGACKAVLFRHAWKKKYCKSLRLSLSFLNLQELERTDVHINPLNLALQNEKPQVYPHQ